MNRLFEFQNSTKARGICLLGELQDGSGHTFLFISSM
jgi:hypothetical protein